MRLPLALILLLTSPGVTAWGQVARSAAVRVGAPLALPPTPIRFSAPSFTPGFALPSAPTPALSLPHPGPLPLAGEGIARAARAEAAPPPVAAVLARTVEAAAPHIEAAFDVAGSADSGRDAGEKLEAVLTGALSRPVFGSLPEIPVNACDSHRPGLLHSGDHAQNEAAPGAPAAPVPAPARRAFTLYAAGVSVVKVGIETLNLVVPILLLSQYGTATMLGALFVSAQVAGLAAGGALSPLIDRLGPAKTLAFAAAAQAAAIAVLPVSVALGLSPSLPVVFGLFALNGALGGVFDIARRSAPPDILGTDEGVLRRYNARLYISRELAAMAAVAGAGWLLHSTGALTTLAIHPVAYAAAAGFFLLLVRARRAVNALTRPSPASGRGKEGVKENKSRWAEWTAGAKLVLGDPAMRLAALVNIPVIALHNTFHAMLAAVYATSVLGSPALAAVLIGAWNAGELAAALFLERRGQKAGPAAWARFAALAGLSAWALWAFPTVWVAAPVAFVLAAATLGNEIGLNSFFQSAAPKERTAAVTGFVYTAATAAAMLVMLAMGWAFDALGAKTGFLILAAVLSAVSGLYLLAARALARRSAETPPSTRSS